MPRSRRRYVVEPGEAEAAPDDERSHPTLLGELEGLEEVILRLAQIWRLDAGQDPGERVQRPRLVAVCSSRVRVSLSARRASEMSASR